MIFSLKNTRFVVQFSLRRYCSAKRLTKLLLLYHPSLLLLTIKISQQRARIRWVVGKKKTKKQTDFCSNCRGLIRQLGISRNTREIFRCGYNIVFDTYILHNHVLVGVPFYLVGCKVISVLNIYVTKQCKMELALKTREVTICKFPMK